MNAKKLTALLLAVVLCLGTLAACNAEPAETTAPPAGTTAPAADTTAPAADTTEAAPLTNAERYPIDFDGTLTVVTGKADADKADNWVRWEEWTGVDVEWITTAQEQTPLLFLDEKQMPDIFFQPSVRPPDQRVRPGRSAGQLHGSSGQDAQCGCPVRRRPHAL